MEETRTTGTENQDGGDASETKTAGTPDDQVRNAESEGDEYVKVSKGELDSWKSKAERANELERENRSLKERQEQSPAASDAGDDSDDPDERAVREWAAKGDPVARRMLSREERIIGAVATVLELRDIEDKSERAEVQKRMKERGMGLSHARLEVQNERLARENEQLQAKLKKEARPDPDVVRTAEREGPSATIKVRKMTESEWDARQRKLSPRERMNEQVALRDGKIELEYGR